MKWIATIPLVIEAADMTREQVIDYLVQQRIIRGPTDAFTLEQVEEIEVAAVIDDEAPQLENEVRDEQQNFEPCEDQITPEKLEL